MWKFRIISPTGDVGYFRSTKPGNPLITADNSDVAIDIMVNYGFYTVIPEEIKD